MKVVARHTSAETLSPAQVAHLDTSDLAGFGLVIGREYTVFGMIWDEDGLFVLILAGAVRARPKLISIELFEVSDPALGKDWLFLHEHQPGGDIHAMWGYPELVQDDINFDGLFSMPRMRAHEAFAVAARREDLSDREIAELAAHEAYLARRAIPATPPEDLATSVAAKILAELEDDYVGFWKITWHIRRTYWVFSDDELREISAEVLTDLVARGVTIGTLDKATGSFDPWPVDGAVDAVMSAWRDLGSDPNIWDIAWLAPTSWSATS